MFRDTLIVDKARTNSDGYMAVRARAARTGIYDYLGAEIDPEGKHFAADEIVKVYRPPEEVFDKKSIASYVGKPVTNDHPMEPVTSKNWRDVAGGTIMSATRETLDEGDFITFDLAFMDASLIRDIEKGKRELSNGYGADIVIEDGKTPDGQRYQAVQRNMVGNHVAVVDRGRAGSQCRIGDAARCDVIDANTVKPELISSRTYADRIDDAKKGSDSNAKDIKSMPKFIVIDGLQVDISDAETAERTIKTLQTRLEDATDRASKAETEVATLTTDKSKLEAEKATLEKRLEDAKPKPADLRDAAKRFARVVDMAKKMGYEPDEDEEEEDIKRDVVKKKLGDLAANWTDEQIAASFESLCADVKDEPAPKAGGSANNLRDAIRSGPANVPNVRDDLAAMRNRRLASIEDRFTRGMDDGRESA